MDEEGKKIIIGIGASSDPDPNPMAVEKARVFSRTLSRYRDEVILMSGGDGGLMKIACREFVENGGTTIGVIPLEDEFIDPSHPRYSPYNSISILTGVTYQMRSIPIARSCDTMVILGGGAGTMIEAFLAYLYRKPLIIITGTGYPSDKLVELCEDGYLDHRRIVKAYFVEDPAQAAELAYRLAKSRS